MEIPFFKYEGTGNDFILVDRRSLNWIPAPTGIVKLCDRHFGIGADGLMLLDLSQGYDFRMTYFNSDGYESTMCGNGGRCITAFADRLGLGGPAKRFRAIDGEHHAVILQKFPGGMDIRLKMNDVVLSTQPENDFIIDTGSPHFVRFVRDAEQQEVIGEGRKVRYSDPFRDQGVNVDFVENRYDHLYVRTYERGVENETLSCGTGVTASVLAHAVKNGLDSNRVRVETLGGTLHVSFSRKDNQFREIWLEGTVKEVFSGKVNVGD